MINRGRISYFLGTAAMDPNLLRCHSPGTESQYSLCLRSSPYRPPLSLRGFTERRSEPTVLARYYAGVG